jgi:LTXXQ motif family protein
MAGPAFAQQRDHDQHHPGQPPAAAAPSPGMPGGAMAGAGGMPMMLREKMMTAHLEALHRLKAAVDPLYAALSDEQKKTADELLMGPMGMM